MGVVICLLVKVLEIGGNLKILLNIWEMLIVPITKLERNVKC